MDGKNQIKPYEKVVAYWETDMMGIVHHSNYVKWFEEARLDFLRKIDIPYEQIEDAGYMLPVYEVIVKYKNPARFAQTIFIETFISDLSNIKVELSYKVKDKNHKILALARTIHPFTDKNLKIKKMPGEIYDKFYKVYKLKK